MKNQHLKHALGVCTPLTGIGQLQLTGNAPGGSNWLIGCSRGESSNCLLCGNSVKIYKHWSVDQSFYTPINLSTIACSQRYQYHHLLVYIVNRTLMQNANSGSVMTRRLNYLNIVRDFSRHFCMLDNQNWTLCSSNTKIK